MGHHAETWTIPLTEARTAEEALTAAVWRWRDDEDTAPSHGCRSGTIRKRQMMTELVATRAEGSEGMNVFDGESLVIPVCSEADSVERIIKRKITVTGAQLASIRGRNSQVTYNLARAALGPTVVSAKASALPKARKAVAAATEGKAVTRYTVVTVDRVSPEGWRVDGGQIIGHAHASQAEARAAALELVNTDARYSSLGVRATITRDSGSLDLVRVDRPEADSSEVTLDVTLSTPRAGAAQTAWVVSFDVHT